MKKEQRILTFIIVLAILGIVILGGTIVYDEKMAKNKETVETIEIPVVDEENIVEEDENDEEDLLEEVNNEVYVGEEEKEEPKEETTIQNNNEKAIELVKKEWGEDDNEVTFNIEEKNDTKYYVAIRKESRVLAWYEVDTENWSVSEY